MHATCCLYADFALRSHRKSCLAVPTGELAALDQNPPRPSAKRRFLSGWLAAIGHRRCVPTVKVVPWNQPIASATFAIGRYRIAEVRTNRSHLARHPPAHAPSSTSASRPPHWPRRCSTLWWRSCAAALGFRVRTAFQGPYLILALIVFSLTFPGAPAKSISLRGLAGDVMSSWFCCGCAPPAYRLGDADAGLLRPRASSSPGYSQRRSLCSPHGADACRSGAPARGGGRAKNRRHCRDGVLGHKLAERIRTAPFSRHPPRRLFRRSQPRTHRRRRTG